MAKKIFRGKVWKYPGPAGWYFVYASKAIADTLKKRKAMGKEKTVGFGFVPVTARVGKTSWQTTLFPTKEGPYLIAIKADVRKKEGITEGDTVNVSIEFP